MIINLTNDATRKMHTFQILQEGNYKCGGEFYLVKDLKARKRKYQIISLNKETLYFHSYGDVFTGERALEWFNDYSKRCAIT